jgi:hypothetical protein
MGSESDQIDEWRRQMAKEEEDEYEEEQRQEDMRASRTVTFSDAAKPAKPTKPAVAAATLASPAKPVAAAAHPAANFNWNAGAMAQLQQFGVQNADLMDQLEQKEKEIKNIKRQTELKELTGGIRPMSAGRGKGDHDPRDAKIVELAKKNRAMSLQFEKERSSGMKLRGELKRANDALQTMQMQPGGARLSAPKSQPKPKEPWAHGKTEPDEDMVPPSDELKQLRLKVKESGSRLADQKVTNNNLKAELDKVKRLLKTEVGAPAAPPARLPARTECRAG